MNFKDLSSAKVATSSLQGGQEGRTQCSSQTVRLGESVATLHYTLSEVSPYINWLYFFHAWGFPARFAGIAQIHGCDGCRASWLASFPVEDRAKAAEAMQLHKEALRMLAWLDKKGFKTHVRFGLFECNSEGEDIIIHRGLSTMKDGERLTGDLRNEETPIINRTTLSFLRQQTVPYLCLADFIRPVNAEGKKDRIGIFAACADESIEQLYSEPAPDADTYKHLLCQTLADRLAEATIECAHQAVRRSYWGYAPDEQLSIADLHAERFQGIRPAVGYPSLPDQSLNFDLDRLIDFSVIGIRLTENGAMQPHASVSGFMFAHPDARYFAIGPIGEDQLADYAQRKGRTPKEIRPFLTANL